MPIDFPASPTNGQTYSFGTRTWVYNGTGWALYVQDPTPVSVNSTAADILSVNAGVISADDPNTDTLWGWDDSQSKAIGYTLGTGMRVDSNFGTSVCSVTNLTYDPSTRYLHTDTGWYGYGITLPHFSGSVSGLAPASGGVLGTYLQSDGSWQVPAGVTNLGYTASTRILTSDTGSDVTLPLFSSADPGLTPASGGGTTAFLRADGSWAAPTSGVSYFYFDASEFIPSTTTGCGIDSQETTTNKVNRDFLLFDPGTIEYATRWFVWPSDWTTFKVTFYWTATSGTGSAVLAAQARVYTDADANDTAWGTAQEVTDAAASASTHRQSPTSAGITPGGTVGGGKLVALRIYRNATSVSDDLAVDAQVMGVLVEKAS